jgi:hypothetical protein
MVRMGLDLVDGCWALHWRPAVDIGGLYIAALPAGCAHRHQMLLASHICAVPVSTSQPAVIASRYIEHFLPQCKGSCLANACGRPWASTASS